MNIFYLSKDPAECARFHSNSHVVKMIVELAQMLSTAHRVLDGVQTTEKTPKGRSVKRWKLSDSREDVLYKATHVNHPSAVWIRASIDNYIYAYSLLEELCTEYTYRYDKIHKTASLLDVLSELPANIADKQFVAPPQCMPDYCKKLDCVEGYRNYYLQEKGDILQYTRRPKPFWIKE